MGAARMICSAAGLALLGTLMGCAPPAAPSRYTVGQPYQMGGVWSYPREDFALVETGLASVAPTSFVLAPRRTTSGETYDATLLTAAHRTLQLPAILLVTNLETGLAIEVRVNDRGPANPGRVVELSRRAAELIGIPANGVGQVRIAVNGPASQALAGTMPSTEVPRLEVAGAPVAAVQREELAPPPGAVQASRVREARALPGVAVASAPEAPAPPPQRLPERVERVAPQPGRIFVEAASFARFDLANRQAARIGGRVEAIGPRNNQSFRVRIGPLASVAEADQALERTLRSGVSEARILID